MTYMERTMVWLRRERRPEPPHDGTPASLPQWAQDELVELRVRFEDLLMENAHLRERLVARDISTPEAHHVPEDGTLETLEENRKRVRDIQSSSHVLGERD